MISLVDRLDQLADVAERIADGVARELPGELARQARVHALELAILARNARAESDADAQRARAALRRPLCARCGNPAGVDGLCAECEATLRG